MTAVATCVQANTMKVSFDFLPRPQDQSSGSRHQSPEAQITRCTPSNRRDAVHEEMVCPCKRCKLVRHLSGVFCPVEIIGNNSSGFMAMTVRMSTYSWYTSQQHRRLLRVSAELGGAWVPQNRLPMSFVFIVLAGNASCKLRRNSQAQHRKKRVDISQPSPLSSMINSNLTFGECGAQTAEECLLTDEHLSQW